MNKEKKESEIVDVLADLLEKGKPGPSKVMAVNVWVARELFGEKAYQPDRLVLEVVAENAARLVMNLPTGIVVEDGEYIVKNEASALRSLRNPANKLGRYLSKYGALPFVDQVVDTYVDGNGGLRIAL